MLKQIGTKLRHSGLDPESSSAPLDSRFRRNDGLFTRSSMTAYSDRLAKSEQLNRYEEILTNLPAAVSLIAVDSNGYADALPEILNPDRKYRSVRCPKLHARGNRSNSY